MTSRPSERYYKIMPSPFDRFDDFKPGKSANKFAVGNRTYNGMSPSPQAGKGGLNPKGFAERETRARAKRRLLTSQLGKRR